MDPNSSRPAWTLTIEPLPGWSGTHISRLRMGLKSLARSFGFKVVSIEAANDAAKAVRDEEEKGLLRKDLGSSPAG